LCLPHTVQICATAGLQIMASQQTMSSQK